MKWLLITIGIVAMLGVSYAAVNPIISDTHSYLDILHVTYLHGDISNATGMLPNASIPLSAFNKSAENQYALRATGGNGNPIVVERAIMGATNVNTNFTIANITFNDNYASFFIDINLVGENTGSSVAYVSARRFIQLSSGSIGTLTTLGTDINNSMNYYFVNQPSPANSIQVIVNATAADSVIYQGSVKVIGSNGDGQGTEGIVINP